MMTLKRLPLLAVLPALLLVLGPGADVAVAAKKLFVGSLSWDTDEQSVVVPMAVSRSVAERSDYFILTFVLIFDGRRNLVAQFLSDPHPIVPLERASRNDRFVKIVPQFIHWDRNNGEYTGRAAVVVISQIFNARGRPLDEGRSRGFGFVTMEDDAN